MNIFEEILQKFDPITLSEMDGVKFMNRIDTKYIFKTEFLTQYLNEIVEYYRILEINHIRLNIYNTLYFDTKNFLFYNQHQCGKLNRTKVRFRSYINSNLHFFEIKKKNNKGITIKERIKRNKVENYLSKDTEKFLYKLTRISGKELEPKLNVNYSRITLVNKNQPERLTIDINLVFKNEKNEKFFPDIVIAEKKQTKNIKTPFSMIMQKHHIQKTTISKYCYGVIFLYNNIRKNNFKHKILTFNKIYYGKV